MKNRLVRFLFKLIWRRWLEEGDIIVGVHGWNKCTYDMKCGTRVRATMCCFPWD